MVTHTNPASTVWQDSVAVNKANVRTFVGETDDAIDANHNAVFAYHKNGYDVSDLIEGTGVIATDTTSAAANTTLINAALADSASNGTFVRIPPGDWPITQIVPPNAGGFTLEMAPGAWFRPVANQSGGFVRSADPTVGWSDTRIYGFRIKPYIDSGTSTYYTGNGMVARLNNGSWVEDCQVYFEGDQAFVVALYDSSFHNVYMYTEDTAGGSGGFRINAGRDSMVTGVRGQSGDDFVMLNVSAGGVFASTSILNCGYRDVIGKSLGARLAISFVASGSSSGSVLDCFFDNVRGEADNQCLYLASEVSGRPIRRMRVSGCGFDDQSNSSTATPENILIAGNVQDSTVQAIVTSPVYGLVRCAEDTGQSPVNISFQILSHQAPSTGGRDAFTISAGTRIKIHDSEFVAPAGQAGVNFAAGDRHQIINSRIAGVDTGVTGVRATGTATRPDVYNVRFTGSGGNAYNFNSTAADGTTARAKVINCDLGGLSTAGTAPFTDQNRA